jgi:cytochrome c biogenesis protein CcmG, thiol:disulfide interchange protein DsbE
MCSTSGEVGASGAGKNTKPSAFDAEGRVAIDWGVYGAPETFLVDESGNVIFKHVGPITVEIWERDFVPLIRAAKGSSS